MVGAWKSWKAIYEMNQLTLPILQQFFFRIMTYFFSDMAYRGVHTLDTSII